VPRSPCWIFCRHNTAAASKVSFRDDYLWHKKHICSPMCVCRRAKARHSIRRHDVCGVRWCRSLSSVVARRRGAVRSAPTDGEPKTRCLRVRGRVLRRHGHTARHDALHLVSGGVFLPTGARNQGAAYDTQVPAQDHVPPRDPGRKRVFLPAIGPQPRGQSSAAICPAMFVCQLALRVRT